MGCLLGVLCHQKVWITLQLILSLLAFPQTAVERDGGFLTGGGDVLRHHRGIGVGGVDDQVKAFLLHQLLHLLPVHSSRVDGQIRLRVDERFPVLGGNAGGDLHLAARQIFCQLAPFGGACKQQQLIHFYILLG